MRRLFVDSRDGHGAVVSDMFYIYDAMMVWCRGLPGSELHVITTERITK